MKKYKLIEIYPGSPKLGAIAFNKNGSIGIIDGDEEYTLSSSKSGFFYKMIYNHPKYWQEIVEKDYEILSFIADNGFIRVKNEDGVFYASGGINHDSYTESNFLIRKSWVIHSVKRLSDGEVFTIGDQVRLNCNKKSVRYPILYIKLEKICGYEGLYIYIDGQCSSINNFTKADELLFITEDGVDIFEGDYYYELITPDFHNKPCIWNILPDKTRGNIIYDQEGNRRNGRIWFSTKEAAEEYILMNKPCLSINDVFKIFKGTCSSNVYKQNQLKKLAKSKL